MTLFKNETHQDIWVEHHCDRCYFGRATTICPILGKALSTNRKPVEWDRNTRKNVLMQDSIKCNMETRTPPKFGGVRQVTDETGTLFAVDIPVHMDGDHA